jgi:hypothetical protein
MMLIWLPNHFIYREILVKGVTWDLQELMGQWGNLEKVLR